MDKDTIYLITNMHRSGSSMMMRCLEAGGMDAFYDDGAVDLKPQKDYDPNPNGYYQNDFNFLDHAAFDQIKGKLLKCPIRQISSLPEGNYKVIVMMRDPEEIRASMNTAFGGVLPVDDVLLDVYAEYMAALVSKLGTRGDMQVTVLEYAEVVEDPVTSFIRLTVDGWNFDIDKAAAMVDPALRRFNLEQK